MCSETSKGGVEQWDRHPACLCIAAPRNTGLSRRRTPETDLQPVWRLEFGSSLELGSWTLGASLSPPGGVPAKCAIVPCVAVHRHMQHPTCPLPQPCILSYKEV